MSLINDALKRAKEAQQQAPAPPPSQMQFRPVEPAQYARRGLGLMVPAALTMVALIALLFVWQWTQARKTPEPQQARALTARDADATLAPQPSSTLVAAGSTTPVPAAQPGPPLQPASHSAPATVVANPLVATAPGTPASPSIATEQDSEVTNTSAITLPPPPKPAPLRLQAIVFNPKRPSALISGKTLFIGDKLGDLRVVAIDQESATLVGAGKTNVLSLPE